MPRYRVTMPDGRTYSIDGPAGASKDQVIAAVQRRIGAAAPAETTLGGEIKEAAKGLIPGAAGLLETAATGAAALLPEEQELAIRGEAAELAGGAREMFKAAPGYEQSMGRKFGEAAGSTIPFFGLGPLGAAGRIAATGLGIASGAGEARQRAEMEGGEAEKGLATLGGAAVGTTEVLPVFSFIKRLPENVQLTMVNRVRRALETAGEEGAQEAAQQIAQNLIAKGLYKPSQELLDSAGEEGAYGAGVGAFIQVLTDMALGRRAVQPVAPPQTAEEKLVEPETPAIAPPGTAAAAQEDVAKRTEMAQTVRQAVSDEQVAKAREIENRLRQAEELRMVEAQKRADEEEMRRVLQEQGYIEAPEESDFEYAPSREVRAAPAAGEEVISKEPDRVSQRIIESGAGSDFVKDLYSPNPVDAVLNNFEDLDTVTRQEINDAKNYIKDVSQNALKQQYGDEVTLYRGLKGTEDKAPVLSYSLDKNTAKFNAEQQGIRTGKIEEIKVPVSEVLSYSDAIGRGTFDEAEVIIPNKKVAPKPAEVVEPEPEPEYTMRDAALEVFKDTGKTSVNVLKDRLAISVPEAKALRQQFIDDGLLVRKGNTYVLKEVEEAPSAKAAEVKDVAVRPRDIEPVDTGAVGRGDVLPAPRPVSERLDVAEPSVAAVEPISEPAVPAAEGAEAVTPALEDLETAQQTGRPTSIRRAALDFIRSTGKADPISLQQALGITLSDARALRQALEGSGAIVPQGKNRFAVFEDLQTLPQTPAREGRIEGESLSETRPEVLQFAPRPTTAKEIKVDERTEAANVAEAQARRAKSREDVEAIKEAIRKLVEEPGTQQYGLDLVGGEARGVTRKKLSTSEVSNARELGLSREAVDYSNNPNDVAARKGLFDALNNKRREIGARALALRDVEKQSRKEGNEKIVKDSVFRDIFTNLQDPQITIGDLAATERKLKFAERKHGGREVVRQAAPEQVAAFEEDAQFEEAVQRSKAREEAEKEARREQRKKREREIGLRFERGKGLGLDADRVYEVLDKVMANWKNRPRLFVVQSISEIPENLRDRVPSDAKGFYVNGDVFIIADNASSEAGVKATLFHESLGHFGLKNLFGRRLREVTADIYRTNADMRRAADKWLKENPTTYDYMDRNERISMAVEEVLAEASSQGQFKQSGIRAAFNRIAALIRKFVRGMGIPINYSNNDVTQALIQAHESVITNDREQRLGADKGIRFQREQARERLSNVFDVNLNAPKYDSKIGDGVRGALGNVFDSLRDGAISFFSIPQIAEVWEKELPSVRALDNILGLRGSAEMKRREQVSTNVTKWFELSNKYKDRPQVLDRFFQVANMTTIYQVDPLESSVQAVLKKSPKDMNPFDKVSYDIVSEYNRLPADLRAAYREMRQDYERSSKEFEKLLEQRLGKDALDRIKNKYDQKKLQVYLPLWRSGSYWLTYTDKNGETITSAYATDIERQRAKEAALKDKAKDIQEFSRLREARRGAPPTGFLGDVVKALEGQGLPDDAIDAVYEAYLNYLPAESIRQLRRPRESSFDITTGVDRYGVFGFEPDVFQAYANVAPRIANQLTNLEYAIPLEEVMRDLYKESGGERARDPVLAAVYRNLQKQVNFIRNPEKNWLVDGASYFSYLWFIAGNISSALINTTQLPLVVAPLLGGKYGYGKTTAAMEKAISTYLNGGWDTNNGGKNKFPSDYTFGAAAKLDSKYKKLYDAAVARSVIRRSTGYEISEAQKTGVKDFVGVKARVTHGLGWIFQNSERFNREVTLLAAFDLAYEKTKDVDKAVEEAIRLVNDAHGSALAETGPRLFQQGLGKVMFTFKRFAQAQIYLLGKLFNQAFRDADPTTREVARSQLLGIFGSAFLIAGIQGMPMFGLVEMLANYLMGDDDEPYDFKAYINEKFKDLGSKGLLNKMLGVDIASRTGFNGLIWKDDPQRMAEVGPYLYVLEQAMGPAYGAFLSADRGRKLFGEGEYERGIEAIMPSFIRNAFKAIRLGEEGARNKDGTPVVADISTYNTMMQAVGFNPAEVAEARARAGARKEISDKLISRRQALINQYVGAWQERDLEGAREAMNSIRKFNAKNPYQGLYIGPETLQRSIIERRKRQLLSVDGLYTPLNYRQRIEQLRTGEG